MSGPHCAGSRRSHAASARASDHPARCRGWSSRHCPRCVFRPAVGALRLRSPQSLDAPSAFGGGRAGEAWRFCRLGAQLRRQGRLAAAVESFETAVWIFRDLDEPHGLALALNGLGLALVRQRRLDAAIARYEEAAEILGRIDDGHAQGQVLANLATALRSQGRTDEAQASLDDALARLEPGSAEHVRIRELRAV